MGPKRTVAEKEYQIALAENGEDLLRWRNVSDNIERGQGT
jgi:hypothetical protein